MSNYNTGIRILILIFCLHTGCTYKTEQQIIDETIEKYDNVSFEKFANLYLITYRKQYIHSYYEITNYPYYKEAYYIEINNFSNKITSISKALPPNVSELSKEERRRLTDLEYKDSTLYIGGEDVKQLIVEFSKMDLFYLVVDSCSNVMMSPVSNERPYLLRVSSDAVTEKHIEVDRLPFTHYKGKWYIYDFYIED